MYLVTCISPKNRNLHVKILLLHLGHLTLHSGQDRGSLFVSGEVTAEVVALGAADLVMDGEVVLHEEGAVADPAEVTHQTVLGADGVHGHRELLLDGRDQPLPGVLSKGFFHDR